MTEILGNTTSEIVLTSLILMMSGSWLGLLLRNRILPGGQKERIRIFQKAFLRKRS